MADDRDIYKADYILRYYPRTDIMSYSKHLNLMTNKTYKLAMLKKQEMEQLTNQLQHNSILSTVAAVFAGVPIVFYKRIPWIRTFTSTRARVLWSIFFLLMPISVVSAYQATRFSDLIGGQYKANA